MATVAFDIEAVRRRFSALERDLVLFDGPGGTQVPDEVGAAVVEFYRTSNANLGGPFETSRRDGRARRRGARDRRPRSSAARRTR